MADEFVNAVRWDSGTVCAAASSGTVVVVGASVAGVAAATALRDNGFPGRVILADASAELPHDKPALSKEILTGELDEDDITLLSEHRARDLDIELALGQPALRLDPKSRTIRLPAGGLAYDAVIIATGAGARMPRPLRRPSHVYTLRDVTDARMIGKRMRRGQPKLAVVGGGFIGCEVAASACRLGLQVTVIDTVDHLLARALPQQLAAPIEQLHRSHGVEIRCGAAVVGLSPLRKGLALRLRDTTIIDADMVVVGVGASPNTKWLAHSGVALDDGVLTDSAMRTTVPGVYAVGDVARRRDNHGERGVRTEHWTAARDAGRLVAANLAAGSDKPYTKHSYVWSDQFGHRLQLAGDTCVETEFLTGGGINEPYVAVCRRGDEIAGVVAFDDGAGFRRAQRLIGTDPAAKSPVLTEKRCTQPLLPMRRKR
ncbi:NAD(P)/FAD-dependent oxidoreductase [Mycobacterium sp. 3519A]|uniref:NAD(P)/FAD-dependent oxidoreductase n=1 Tax=Mycobacterium sp. 3519A TaxID=2057184 RepID=UPI000C7A4B2E|nr:FAD-dependent oxidoreductase [Mycobacterium sp. 3519A]